MNASKKQAYLIYITSLPCMHSIIVPPTRPYDFVTVRDWRLKCKLSLRAGSPACRASTVKGMGMQLEISMLINYSRVATVFERSCKASNIRCSLIAEDSSHQGILQTSLHYISRNL